MGGGIPSSQQVLQHLSETYTKLTSIYATAKVDNKSLEPELTEILSKSRDYDELLDAYIGWRNVTGPFMKNLYQDFVKGLNQGARDTGYEDAGAFW